MNVYVLLADDNFVHAFIANDDLSAAVIARRMIDNTAYGYKADSEILKQKGYKPENPPAIFDAIIDLLCIELNFEERVETWVRSVNDPLLAPAALKGLFAFCDPFGMLDDKEDEE